MSVMCQLLFESRLSSRRKVGPLTVTHTHIPLTNTRAGKARKKESLVDLREEKVEKVSDEAHYVTT